MKNVLKRTAAAVMAFAAVSGALFPAGSRVIPAPETVLTAEAAGSVSFSKGILKLSGEVTREQISAYKNTATGITAEPGTVLPADSSAIFSGFTKVETIDLCMADTSRVTSLREAFSSCPKLIYVDLTGFDFSSLADTSKAFYNCSKLTTIYASDDWSPALRDIKYDDMFAGCTSLVGRNGRAYSQYFTGISMARIDGHEELSGYFSTKECTSLDEATGTLTLFGYVYENDVAEYIRDDRVKTVIAENGAVLPANCSSLFSNFRAEKIDLSNADVSRVTDMSYMFTYCMNMKTLILHDHFITDKVKKVGAMFYCCESLPTVDLSGADITGAKDLSFMFYRCDSLESLDLTSFNTVNITETRQMFYGCKALKTVFVGDNWNTDWLEGSVYSKNMFNGCTNIVGGNGTVYDKTLTDAGCAHIDSAADPGYFSRREVSFKTNSMTLGGSISLNFYVALTAVPDDRLDDTYVEFTVNGKKQTAKLDRNKMNSKKIYYCFNCKLSSVAMADDVKAVLTYYTADGKAHKLNKVFTAETYLNKFNSNDDKTTFDLIKGINDYGYYMQKYLSVHSASPWKLGVDHKAMKKAYADHSYYNGNKSAYLSEINGLQKSFGSNSNIEKVNYTLVLDSDTSINLKFKKKSGYTGKFTVTVDGNTVSPKTLSDGRLQVTIANISAHKLGDMHTVKVTTASGTTTYKVSALSYVYECINAPGDALEYDAMCALYEYYKATIAYRNK